ncbi:hypothetical protein HQ590_10005 [bacterium]|nr:hypothetical protein [bacterium]
MRTWKAALGVALIFLLGMAAGGLLTAKLLQHKMRWVALGGPPVVGDIIVRRLSWQLRLDRTQREQVRGVMTDTQRELEVLRTRIRPEARRILTAAEEHVRAVLRPEQAARFDRLLAERKARWGPGGPPSG